MERTQKNSMSNAACEHLAGKRVFGQTSCS